MRAVLALILVTAAAAQAPPELLYRTGDSGGDFLGFSVSTARDINRDGFDDLVVGAPFNGSGTAKVLSGFDGSVLRTLVGVSQGDGFGGAVSTAGDVDNDGWPDLVIGSYRDDNYGLNAGSAVIISGQDYSVIRTLTNGVAESQFGFSVSSAGDVNLDGYADVLVGAPNERRLNGQQVLIESGSATVFSGFDGSVLFKWFGDGGEDLFGHAVGEAGDVNADGYLDLMVGAPWDDNSFPKSGMVRVFSTNPLDAADPVLYSFNGDGFGAEMGWSLCGAGDVDGDGYDDLLLGQPEDKVFGDDSGSVALCSGFDGSRLQTYYGTAPYNYFGYSVAAADLDFDGVPDLVIGEYRHDEQPFDDRGVMHVYSGASYLAPPVEMYSIVGQNGGDRFGQVVASAGDFNADGFPDVVASAPFATTPQGSQSGYVQVFCGSPSQGRANTYGVGCPLGSALELDYSGTYSYGSSFSIDISNGPATPTAGWVTFGFYNGPPFPISLSLLGWFGCLQYATADLIGSFGMNGGTASFPLVVPPTPGSCGLRLYNQAIVLDAGVPNGVRVSNAGALVLSPQ